MVLSINPYPHAFAASEALVDPLPDTHTIPSFLSASTITLNLRHLRADDLGTTVPHSVAALQGQEPLTPSETHETGEDILSQKNIIFVAVSSAHIHNAGLSPTRKIMIAVWT